VERNSQSRKTMWSPRKERTKNCEIMVAGSSANPATPLFQVDLRTPKPHSSRTQGKARQVIEEASEYKARNLFDPVHTNPNMMSVHSIHPNSTRSMRERRIRTIENSLVLVLTGGLASQGGKKKSPAVHAAPGHASSSRIGLNNDCFDSPTKYR
jgi:hypothetical protein